MGTSLIRNRAHLGLYSRIMPRALWWPYGRLLFLVSEVTMKAYVGVQRAARRKRWARYPGRGYTWQLISLAARYRTTSLIRNRTPLPWAPIGP